MPFCHQCGTELQTIDRFCAKCGAGQHEESRAGAETVKSPVEPALKYKGVGIRFAAQIVDGVICLIIFGIIGSMAAGVFGGTTPDGFELEGFPAIMVQLFTAVSSLLYFSLLEAFWNGQTLGKKIVCIQVVREDGSGIDLSAALIRNLLRIVDGLGFYLVAAILVWRSPKKQRLGDRVANTFVVKKIASSRPRSPKRKKLKLTSKDDVFIADFD